MKCLTIKPFWLEKILSGEKTLEIRSFSPKYRGDIILCSSKVKNNPGQALAVAKLTEIITPNGVNLNMLLSQAQVDLNQIKYKKFYFWKLENIRLIEPVDILGQLGIFEREIKIVYK